MNIATRRITNLRTSALFLAAVVAAAFPGATRAATPFSLGPGFTPDVAISSDGTAHVVWDAPPLGAELLRYCQIPRGRAVAVSRMR